jgi:hypothetical protein
MVNHYGNFNHQLVGGIPTPLKNDGAKVSWDDEIPYSSQLNGKTIQMFQSPPTR